MEDARAELIARAAARGHRVDVMDPNAEPTPAEFAAWRTADLAAAQEWAAGRLERARQLGDVEILQHLGNLLAAAARVAELEAEVERLRTLLRQSDEQVEALNAELLVRDVDDQ